MQGRREETLRIPAAGGTCVEVHAVPLATPLLQIAGVRQYQFAQLDDGIRIRVMLAAGCDLAEISAAIEQAIRTFLAPLRADTARIEVEIVDQIERTGSAAKEKLVASVNEC